MGAEQDRVKEVLAVGLEGQAAEWVEMEVVTEKGPRVERRWDPARSCPHQLGP